jgi:hypothetical protein
MGQSPILADGECLWVAFDGQTIFGAATTILWDDGEAQLILAAGTRHREWVGELDATITQWARSAGARKLTMRGRKGWARYASRFGWVVLGPDTDGWLRYEKQFAEEV